MPTVVLKLFADLGTGTVGQNGDYNYASPFGEHKK